MDNGGTLEIVEENNYYPFGLKHKGYNEVPMSSLGNDVAQKWKYQNQELNESFDYNMYEFELSHYDAAIGRFVTTDPYEQFHSPYVAMGNNPVVSFNPDGGNCFDVNGNPIACPNDDIYNDYRENDENHITILDGAGGVAEDMSKQVESDQNRKKLMDDVKKDKFVDFNPEETASAVAGISFGIANLDGPVPVADVPAGAVLVSGLAGVALLQATENLVNKWHPILSSLNSIPPPKTLPGFPGAVKARRKNERARWHFPNGDIGEWDSQHGEVEVYDKQEKSIKEDMILKQERERVNQNLVEKQIKNKLYDQRF